MSPLDLRKARRRMGNIVAALLLASVAASGARAAGDAPPGPMASAPLVLDLGTAHHCTVTSVGRGEWKLARAGDDPFVSSHPAPKATADHAREYAAVSFDYRSAGGVGGMQVMLVLQNGTVVASRYMKLAPATKWTRAYCIFKTQIDALPTPMPSPIHRVRLDLPDRGSGEMDVRNLRLQGMDDTISSRIKEADAIERKRQGEEELITKYLSAAWPVTVRSIVAGAKEITITCDWGAMNPAGLYLLELPPWVDAWRPLITNGTEAVSLAGSGGVCTVPRTGAGRRDRLFSRWIVAEKAGAGFRAVSAARWAAVGASLNPEPHPPTGGCKKGILMPEDPRAFRGIPPLGARYATVNVIIDRYFPDGKPAAQVQRYVLPDGRVQHWHRPSVEHVDDMVKFATEHGLYVNLILLVSNPDKRENPLAQPKATGGYYMLPDLSGPEGFQAFTDLVEFIAARYSRTDRKFGRVWNYIVFNEVDSHAIWANYGDAYRYRYMDEYIKSLRLCHLAAGKYLAGAYASVSLTNRFNVNDDPRQSFSVRQALEMLPAFSRAEGDFAWGLAQHPYTMAFDDWPWKKTAVTFNYSTPQITMANIEVLDAWMHRPEMLYGGKPRKVHLSEQAWVTDEANSLASQRKHAAALVYSILKIRPLESILGFEYVRLGDVNGWNCGLYKAPHDGAFDGIGEKKLSADIYAALGTAQEGKALDLLKQEAGLSDVGEVNHKGAIK